MSETLETSTTREKALFANKYALREVLGPLGSFYFDESAANVTVCNTRWAMLQDLCVDMLCGQDLCMLTEQPEVNEWHKWRNVCRGWFHRASVSWTREQLWPPKYLYGNNKLRCDIYECLCRMHWLVAACFIHANGLQFDGLQIDVNRDGLICEAEGCMVSCAVNGGWVPNSGCGGRWARSWGKPRKQPRRVGKLCWRILTQAGTVLLTSKVNCCAAALLHACIEISVVTFRVVGFL